MVHLRTIAYCVHYLSVVGVHLEDSLRKIDYCVYY